jgi:hypothetical protein
MDSLTLFGLATVTLMLVFYALEDRSPWFVPAFAGAWCSLQRSVSSGARGPSGSWRQSRHSWLLVVGGTGAANSVR